MKQLPELFKAWIDDENRDHFEGLKLLSHLTSNRTLIRNLSKKESRYNKEKLLNEIKKLSKSLLTSEILPPQIWPPDPAMPVTNPDPDETKDDEGDQPSDDNIPPITTPPHIEADDLGGERLPSGQPQPEDENEKKTDTPPADHPGGNVDQPADDQQKLAALNEKELSDRHATFGNAEWRKSNIQKTNNLPDFIPPAPPPRQSLPPIDPINPDDAKSVEQLEISYSKMFNKKGMLSNSLRDFKEEENAGRKQIMDQIADINKSMQEIDVKIQHFKTHGALPALTPPAPPVEIKQPVVLPDDPVKITRMINNERSNISKLRRRIKKGHSDPERLAQLEQNLQAKVEIVNELERRLSGSGS